MKAINNYIILKVEKKEENTSKGGLILLKSEGVLLSNTLTATVVSANRKQSFIKDGDTVIINANMGADFVVDEVEYKIITDRDYLVKVVEGKHVAPLNKVLIRIKKEDRDGLFSKWIVKDDGERVQLFTTVDVEESDARASTLFVSAGEVVGVGDGIKSIEVSDAVILDYTVDNEDTNIVFFEENGDKIIAVDGVTTFRGKEEWINASRKNGGKDKMVTAVGDFNIVSPLIAVIHNDKIIARQPYVLLQHESATVTKVSSGGILFEEQEKVVTRKILAIADESKEKVGLQVDDHVTIKDVDVFNIKTPDNSVMQCVLDIDIMSVNLLPISKTNNDEADNFTPLSNDNA